VDASAVMEAAPRLDLLYNKLRRDFALVSAATTPTVIIEIVTAEPPAGYTLDYATGTIVVPSPTLLSVPTELTDATVLYQSVVYPLASLVSDGVDPYPASWKLVAVQRRPLVEALRLWELWEDDGPLAVGKDDVVRWLYLNSQVVPAGAHTALPANYERICDAYRVWGLSPLSLSIPLPCSEVGENLLSPWIYASLPTRFDRLSYPAEYQTAESVGATVALVTVIDYVVATYGRARLPVLVAGLGQHESWDTLLPAVFDTSAAEFEASWRAYLANRYTVAPGF
jgi:hypothetical protein